MIGGQNYISAAKLIPVATDACQFEDAAGVLTVVSDSFAGTDYATCISEHRGGAVVRSVPPTAFPVRNGSTTVLSRASSATSAAAPVLVRTDRVLGTALPAAVAAPARRGGVDGGDAGAWLPAERRRDQSSRR